MRVTPKAVTSPSRNRRAAPRRSRPARHRDIGDVHIVGLQREEGQHDRGRVGHGADRKIDLGSQDDEGQADGDDSSHRHLLQDILEIVERREGWAGDAEEDDKRQ